jgi:hypothetical protein
MSTCPNGHTVEAGQRFCPECGAAVQVDETPSSPDSAADVPTETTTAQPAQGHGSDSEPATAAAPPRLEAKASNRTVLLIVGSVVILGAIGLAFVLLGGGSKHELHGTMELIDSDTASNGCIGTGGYDDIAPGAAVTVRNGDGETLATGRLGEGEAVASFGCTYTFIIDIPDSDFYRIEVTHRGELEFSKSELEANNWEVSASLGSS